MPDLLIELLSEEIPARMQVRAAADLKQRVTDGLVEAGLTYASAGAFSTPRRLALSVEGLLAASPALRERRKGPRADAPDKAIEGFLRATGLAREDLVTEDDKKGPILVAVIERPGRPAAGIVAELLERVVRDFPWPKSMRWGAGSLRWVRPLHSILCILTDETGADIVPLEIDGIVAADRTRGHRFLAPAKFSVAGFEDYAAKLKRARVILSPVERAEAIWADARTQAFALGLEVVEDAGLLAEVAGLVEWPVVLIGEIAERFLRLPPEVLQTSMKEHQKFLSVRDPKSGRIVRFVTVANRTSQDDGATILAGNQKVLAARLSDALFFWDNDLRVAGTDLGRWVEALDGVTFHNQLGSVGDRMKRVAALAREIAPVVGADPNLAEQAALFAKADLVSEMVHEFPELQGLMGRYYLEAAGLPAEVAAAAEEHYAPLGPSDIVPTAPVSVAVALADKIDMLTGFWAIGEKPTGSKDPFALRRAALGVIRLLIENGHTVRLPIYFGIQIDSMISQMVWDQTETFRSAEEWYEGQFDLPELNDAEIQEAGLRLVLVEAETSFVFNFDGLADRFMQIRSDVANDQRDENEDYEKSRREIEARTIALDRNDVEDPAIKAAKNWLCSQLLAFIHDRLKVHLRDRGIRHDVIDACLAMPNNDDLTLLVKRAEALAAFLKTDDGENLLQGFKRANNILIQAEERDGVEYSYGADPKFAETEEERAVFAALDAAEARIAPAMQAEDFGAAMVALAGLRAPLDRFFDTVQVNAESSVLRRNRLNLLSRIRTLCLDVADLTQIEG